MVSYFESVTSDDGVYVNTELGRANEALTSFANGVDDIVRSPLQSRNNSSCEQHVS